MSLTRANMRSEKLLPRCRDRGNSAAARRAPGDAPRSAPRRSRRRRSWRDAPWCKISDRADLIGAAGIGVAELARDLDRVIEIFGVDHIEAEQLLLGLGERPVDHQRRLILAQRGRRR